ncbi:two-component regulator propeller domain-containing protein [Flavobacterium flavigenum]|uniref:two-component regulator propeller domain-containing protein n=1 Tax=Flavobacterium flavigenum TaxID=3003258 RepID=UPI002482C32F|nr:two-component regulator propeller domain-containing protein [Flavobacterium flavigenum]
MKTLKIIILILLLIPVGLRSQSGKLYTSDSQLSSSLINSIYQDSKGYIWIASEDGLNRYDGAKFITYKHIKNNPGSVLNNYVKTIFEDRNKNLFFGFINGLQVYNHATDSFSNILITDNTVTKMSPHVSCMLHRKNGEVLVGTSGYGIFKIDFKKQRMVAMPIKMPIPTYMIHEIYEDKKRNLWILSQDRGLWKVRPDNTAEQVFLSKEHTDNTSSICEDKNGNLFVGTLNHGLYVYNREEKKFISYNPSVSLPVKKLFLDKNNKVLIGTDGMGLHVYDPIEKKITMANFNVSNFDFSMSKIHSIIEDKSGNLWMGLYQKGILLLPPKENNFNYLGYQSLSNNIIGSSCVLAVHKDRKGILWVGTDGDGLYGISADNKKQYHYKGAKRLTVMCVFEDSNGNLWIGTYMNGLAKLNRSTNKFDFVDILFDRENKPVKSIFTITEDHNKNLWIGSLGGGLFSMNLNTNEVVNNDSNAKDHKNVLGNQYVNCILPAQNNRLYVGTYDGLYCLDLKTKNYIKKGGVNHMLPQKIIYSINEDTKGNLWIGTSEGLIYQPKDGKNTVTYTIDNNLPSNIICAIERDKNNNLWLSTNHGISKFNSKSKKFSNFYFNDGLQGNEFSKNASFLDKKNGEIIFGGMKGVTYFNPEKITYSTKSSNVYITGFYIQDKSVKKGMKSDQFEIVNSALIDAKSVNLSYDDNSFSIEFSTLDFTNQQNVTYFYSLEKNKWNKLQQGVNTVTFDNLEPGTYNFKVKAELYGKYTSVRPLTITIHPVWYFSFWLKCLYGLLFLAILYFVSVQIKQRKLAQKKIQEHLQNKQINEAKLQFLTNIAHDIKSPISLVINPLLKLINSDEDITRQKWYQVMYRNSEKILQLVNQVMDVRKIDQGQFSLNFKKTDIIASIREVILLFEEQLQEKNIQLELHYKIPELFAGVDPKYFDRIIQNVISNAVKFVPNDGRIDVFIEENNFPDIQDKSLSTFTVTISDNGNGINEKDIAKIFDRFYQSKNGRKQHSEGTGIGLHLTRSIVELHGGTIFVENNPQNSGCRFIITIPIREDQIKEDLEYKNKKTKITDFQKNTPSIALEEPQEHCSASTAGKRKILVVDDNEEIRDYIFKELAVYYKILTSHNGKEALELVLKEPFDLIISDVKMPVMDGITFCRKVKKNININHIPIILLTAQSHDHNQLEGLDIGADSYITKPFNMEILKKTVVNLIRTRDLLKNNFSGNQSQDDKIKKITMESADEKLIMKIMNFINNNLSNTDLNVEMIANEIGISRVHLHRKLKELTNQSSRDLIRNIRLKQAGELLASKQTNISEVAYLVGFSNVSKFSTSFKQFYGMSPKLYMEENLKKKDANDD